MPTLIFSMLFLVLTPAAFADVASTVKNTSGRKHWVAGSYDRTYCALTHTSGGCSQWGTENFVTGWFEVAPGQQRTFTGKTYVKIAISQGGGKDYIQTQLNAGNLITGEIRTTWVHPTSKFEYLWGRGQNGLFLKGVKVGDLNFPPRVGLSDESWIAFIKNAGMVSFKSLHADSNSQFSID